MGTLTAAAWLPSTLTDRCPLDLSNSGQGAGIPTQPHDLLSTRAVGVTDLSVYQSDPCIGKQLTYFVFNNSV